MLRKWRSLPQDSDPQLCKLGAPLSSPCGLLSSSWVLRTCGGCLCISLSAHPLLPTYSPCLYAFIACIPSIVYIPSTAHVPFTTCMPSTACTTPLSTQPQCPYNPLPTPFLHIPRPRVFYAQTQGVRLTSPPMSHSCIELVVSLPYLLFTVLPLGLSPITVDGSQDISTYFKAQWEQ